MAPLQTDPGHKGAFMIRHNSASKAGLDNIKKISKGKSSHIIKVGKCLYE